MTVATMLQKIPLFSGLTAEELDLLADATGKRAFAKGMIIFHKDSPGQTLYIIESGRVRIFILSESGQEISVNVYGPGEFFGELALLDSLPRSAGAVVMEDTVTLTLQRDDFMRLVQEHPEISMSIMRVLSTRLRYTTMYAEGLAFLDVFGRVAAKLIELADRYGKEGEGVEIALRLTQGELASWIGASRESVNKVLGAFRDQGLIALDGQRITVLDRRELRRRIMY
jgi:CRP/FNR family transcriptional regulator/CRP/FNR family cyclic AMP-dependent transcriptional regulator